MRTKTGVGKRINRNILHPMGRPWIIAHRGYWIRQCVENTVEAFMRALDVGCEMIELDLRKTNDGRVVVFHDQSIEGKKLSEISSCELLEIGFDNGIDIPYLEDVLSILSGRIMINLEIKDPGIEYEVLNQSNNLMPPDSFLISSYKLSILRKIRIADTSVPLGWVVGENNYLLFKFLKVIRKTLFIRTFQNWINYLIPKYKYVNSKLVEYCRSFGIEVLSWTVNNPDEITRLVNLNISGIITDEPEQCLRIISRHLAENIKYVNSS